MSRCIGCNRPLSQVEMCGKKPDDSPEDMCGWCRNKAKEEFLWSEDHEYQLEHITDYIASFNNNYFVNRDIY